MEEKSMGEKERKKEKEKTENWLKGWTEAGKSRKGRRRSWLCKGEEAAEGQPKEALPTVRDISLPDMPTSKPHLCLRKHHPAVINTHLHTETQCTLAVYTGTRMLQILHHYRSESLGRSVRQCLFHSSTLPLFPSFPVLCSLFFKINLSILSLQALQTTHTSPVFHGPI